MQDAQKGYGSHPPSPGAPRRAVPRARPQRAVTFIRGRWDDPNCAQYIPPTQPSARRDARCPKRGPFDSLSLFLKEAAEVALDCAH
jgi:hypothetical protein